MSKERTFKFSDLPKPGDSVEIVVAGNSVIASYVRWNPATCNGVFSYEGKEIERKVRIMGEVVRQVSGVPTEVRNVESIENRFQYLKDFLKLTINGENKALLVSGPGGLGKTFTTKEVLQEMGKVQATESLGEGDYFEVKGYTTPKALYRLLYENRDRLIVIDDCDAAFKVPQATNLLKAALDSYDTRYLSWFAESGPLSDPELPMSFEFRGRVVFLTNIKLSDFPQPVLSRCLYVDLSMTRHEKLERIRGVSQGVKDGLDAAQKAALVEYMVEIADSIKELSVRSYRLSALLVKNFADWKPRVKYLLVQG